MDDVLSIASNRLDRFVLPELTRALARLSLKLTSIDDYRVFCEKLEGQIADKIGVHDCVLTHSGTDAIQLALLSMGIKKGDEVIVPASAYAAVGLAVHYCGAKAVACDVAQDSRLMSADLAVAKITRKTKAIIVIHMYGHCCDMDAFQELARRKKVLLVENACQAFGTRWHGRMAGSFAPMAALSFSYAKTLASLGGNGGALLLRKAGIKKKILEKHIYVSRGALELLKLSRKITRIGFLDALSIALKLEIFDKIEEKKRVCLQMYHQELKDLPEIWSFRDPPFVDSVRPFFLIMARKRDQLYRYLAKRNIICEKEHAQEAVFQEITGRSIKDFPMALELTQRGLRLPLFPLMEPQEAVLIARQIKGFYAQN